MSNTFDPTVFIAGLSLPQSRSLASYLAGCLDTRTPIPSTKVGIDWFAIAQATGIPVPRLRGKGEAAAEIERVAAIVGGSDPVTPFPPAPICYGELLEVAVERRKQETAHWKSGEQEVRNFKSHIGWFMAEMRLSDESPVGEELASAFDATVTELKKRKESGEDPPSTKTIQKFASEMRHLRRYYAEYARIAYLSPLDFTEALKAVMTRHGDKPAMLAKAIAKPAEVAATKRRISGWSSGQRLPSTPEHDTIGAIERHYGMPPGTLVKKLPRGHDAMLFPPLKGVTRHQQKRLARHLPPDFLSRDEKEQKEIITDVQRNILRQPTAYADWRLSIQADPFVIKFPGLPGQPVPHAVQVPENIAPPVLLEQVKSYVDYKIAELPPPDMKRRERWSEDRADYMVPQFGRYFGALVAPAGPPLHGFGLSRDHLHIVWVSVPELLEKHINRQRDRRSFADEPGRWTEDDGQFLVYIGAMLVPETDDDHGWIRAHPEFAAGLLPLSGIVKDETIALAQENWPAYCDKALNYCRARSRKIRRIGRRRGRHRNSFTPIDVVLDKPKPLREFRKILEEMQKRAPDRKAYPIIAAEHARVYLVFVVGLKSGYRQKMLRQMLVVARDQKPFPYDYLVRRERAMLFFDPEQVQESGTVGAWVIIAPREAFKNADAEFFRQEGPHRVVVEDINGLYDIIDRYIEEDRAVLLGRSATSTPLLFVKTAAAGTRGIEYGDQSFYQMYRSAIEFYGIYNKWTGRGAIAGLMPHGPYAMRDVLATHVRRVTGSWERAADAIQDSVATVKRHYAKYFPHERADAVTRVTNEAWRE
jgi:hypothetical protein